MSLDLLNSLFAPGLFDFLNLVRKNPNNKANFDRTFTRALQQFKDFSVITKGFSGQLTFSNPGRKKEVFSNFPGFNAGGTSRNVFTNPITGATTSGFSTGGGGPPGKN